MLHERLASDLPDDLPGRWGADDVIHPLVCADGSSATCIDCLDPSPREPAEEWEGPACNGRVFFGCDEGYVHCPSAPRPNECVDGETVSPPATHFCDTTTPIGELHGERVYAVGCPGGELPECLPSHLAGGCGHSPVLCEPACGDGESCVDGECRCTVRRQHSGGIPSSEKYTSWGCPTEQRCTCSSGVWDSRGENNYACFETECRDRFPARYWLSVRVFDEELETPVASIRVDGGMDIPMELTFRFFDGWVGSVPVHLSAAPRVEVVIHEGPDASVWATCEGQPELDEDRWNFALRCDGERSVRVVLAQ